MDHLPCDGVYYLFYNVRGKEWLRFWFDQMFKLKSSSRIFYLWLHLLCKFVIYLTEITVENSYVFVNSTINITCQVYGNYSTRENDSTLYFTRDRNGKPSFLRLNDSIISNETTAILQHTISTDDIHKNFYCETNKEERVVHRIEFFIECKIKYLLLKSFSKTQMIPRHINPRLKQVLFLHNCSYLIRGKFVLLFISTINIIIFKDKQCIFQLVHF